MANNWFETLFTDEEILNAEWLRIRGGFPEIGYPEPHNKWLKESPNYADRCKKCGTFRQVDSFTIKKEPRLGKYHFMSLYWTFAIFAVDAVFEALKANDFQGYERWPVHLLKAGKDSDIITQLFIPTIAAPGLVGAEDLNPVRCEQCGQLKYQKYHKRGVMQLRRDSIPADVDFFQTYEWFGEGYQPRRELIVSNRFAQLVYGEQWNKMVFKVVEAI